ncbi:unnamed protein product [Rotaria socialis]|uniref:Uncharacterized protein n=5 Tax=Rotaria socialis TaxID=392032 RepID=A0A817TKD3_9BILA|nr:unnamed protein product [Rotaria socialis]CAF3357974.1 unnamed protein product [Rotaria socialis]CAF4542321.1 unnamed protein product [Rotaria socialis]
MTSKHHNQSSRRHPLKRVRLDNENQGFLTSLNGRVNKKFCRQSSEDSAFVENEKSSDERAFDLFHKEYFSQFRPYFKHYSIAVQFIEHLWLNMIESSKLSFVKKKLKEQGIDDLFTKSYNDTDTFSNDENDSQISRSLNETNQNIVTLNGNHKYSRAFVNDLLYFCKHWITPRFIDKNSSKKIAPLRRSSRIRRAPIKCVCSSCVTTRTNDEHSSSISVTDNDLQETIHRQLIDHYHQLDDQYSNASNPPLLTNNDSQIKVNHINDSSSQMPLSEIIESVANVTPSLSPITSMVSANSNNLVLPPTLSNSSLSISFDSERNENENIPFVMSDSLTTSELPVRRTYVILTELDEPFFGPYPIEFTITI